MVAALHVEGSWVVSGSAGAGVPHRAAGPAGVVGYRCLVAGCEDRSEPWGAPSLTSSVLGRYPPQVPIPSPAATLWETLPIPAAAHRGC